MERTEEGDKIVLRMEPGEFSELLAYLGVAWGAAMARPDETVTRSIAKFIEAIARPKA